MAASVLKVDMSDVTAIVGHIERETVHWEPGRRDAMFEDLFTVIDRGESVEIDCHGSQITALASPALFDVMRRHGLCDFAAETLKGTP